MARVFGLTLCIAAGWRRGGVEGDGWVKVSCTTLMGGVVVR